MMNDYGNSKDNKKTLKTIITILCILLFICLLVISVFAVKRKGDFDDTPLNLVGTYTNDDGMFSQNTSNTGTLVVGINDDDVQYLLLIIADGSEKTTSSIHISRDTICDYYDLDQLGKIKGTIHGKIRDAYKVAQDPLTGLVNVKDAVNKLLCNVRIDHYMSFDMNSADKITDAFGGLDIVLNDDYTYLNPKYTKDSKIHLKGEDALEFIIGDEEKEDVEKIEERNNRYAFNLFRTSRDKLDLDDEYFVKQYGEISRYCLFSSNDFINVAEEAIRYTHGPILEIKGEKTDEGLLLDSQDVEKICLENIYK